MKHVSFAKGKDPLDSGRRAFLDLFPVSARVLSALDDYVELLNRWRNATNLISERDFVEIWNRHIADSAQIRAFAPMATSWLDIGTGAGFPGAVIAILLTDVPGAIVHCVESDRRKSAFLRQVARTTTAPIQVHGCRMEPSLNEAFRSVHAVTARGVTGLTDLVKLTRFIIECGAVGIFPRGKVSLGEVCELTQREALCIEVVSSHVDSASSVVLINRLPQVSS